MINRDLQVIGLQEKEAQVYVAALELGKGTAQQIALKANLKRPTTYVVIEDLMDQGLISSFYEGKKQYFVAESPSRLMDILQKQKMELEQKQQQLKSILPQLHSINNRKIDKPVVKYYEGKEGIVTMVKELAATNSGQSVSGAYNRDVIVSALGEEDLKELLAQRLNENIQSRVLYTWSKGDMQNPPNTEGYRLDAKDFPMNCDIAIYDDKIRIASFKERMIGVVIEDIEISKSFKAIYDLAWKWVRSQQER
jgi:HTH-type transcriptional regulator, sugar sensing transcriptional regulator